MTSRGNLCRLFTSITRSAPFRPSGFSMPNRGCAAKHRCASLPPGCRAMWPARRQCHSQGCRSKCMTCPARARIDSVLTTAVRPNVSGLSRVDRCCDQAMIETKGNLEALHLGGWWRSWSIGRRRQSGTVRSGPSRTAGVHQPPLAVFLTPPRRSSLS